MKKIITVFFAGFCLFSFSQTVEFDPKTNIVTVDGTPVFLLESGIARDNDTRKILNNYTVKNLNGDTLAIFQDRVLLGQVIGTKNVPNTKTTTTYTYTAPRGAYSPSVGTGIQSTTTTTTTYTSAPVVSPDTKYIEITFVNKALGKCEIQSQLRGTLLAKYIYTMSFVKDSELNEDVVREFITKNGTKYTDFKNNPDKKPSELNSDKLKINLVPSTEE